ncbi:MAG: carbonic anhydrase [Oscillospiraceae bacterium]|nr:carbonic anhydrase [Oscillospiraceae bacterium]
MGSYTAEEAKNRLAEGNKKYVESGAASVDASESVLKASSNGQSPFAVVITCSDSRVIPEAIFSAGIGDIFVIRVAGNVMDSHQLGSVEYAVSHLGAKLVVVLGHEHCGAVGAALSGHGEGYIKSITDEIQKAAGDEKDEMKACCLNVKNSCRVIESSLKIQDMKVMGAVYYLESGKVEFL